ncbi:hypothetical protein BDL97_03G015000 [Sphagnum fallax]|nr:hypothetical protein BDL97_03G015000 [Sphagnum fallax]
MCLFSKMAQMTKNSVWSVDMNMKQVIQCRPCLASISTTLNASNSGCK